MTRKGRNVPRPIRLLADEVFWEERSLQTCAQMFPYSDRRRVFERSHGTARIAWPYLASSSLAFGLFFPYGHSVMSRSIGEPLADDTFQRAFGAAHVVYAQLGAVAIAEIELGKIAVQVLLFAVLINADHAALENRKIAFGGVGMRLAADIFLRRVVHGFVAGKLGPERRVPSPFIGHERAVPRDVGADDRRKIGYPHALDMEAAGRSAALYQGQHG